MLAYRDGGRRASTREELARIRRAAVGIGRDRDAALAVLIETGVLEAALLDAIVQARDDFGLRPHGGPPSRQHARGCRADAVRHRTRRGWRSRWPASPTCRCHAADPWFHVDAASIGIAPEALFALHDSVDYSAGRWRTALYSCRRDWPAVHPPHERWKIRLPREGRLVKFVGLGPYGNAARAEALADGLSRLTDLIL